MQKVLFVSNTANFSKFNRPFMRWFTSQGWQVDYASPAEEQVLDCNQSYKVNIPRSPFSLKTIKAVKQLKKIIKENRYDIVHCHTPMGSIVARLAAKNMRKNGVKVIYTAHGFHFFKGAPILNWILFYPIEKIFSGWTDAIVTINEEDYQIAKRRFIKPDIYKTNGVGVDLSRFYPVTKEEKLSLRRERGYNDKDFIILYIAEFIPRKNHQMLLNAIPELKKRIPTLKIILCGKGVLLESCKNYVESLHENGIVNFTGYTKEVDKYCQLADVHVATSKQEGLGTDNIEAMASGLPVVCSRIRGHLECADLFDLSDSKKMIDEIVELYNNESKRLKEGKLNVERAKKFSVDIAVQNMSKIYQKYME